MLSYGHSPVHNMLFHVLAVCDIHVHTGKTTDERPNLGNYMYMCIEEQRAAQPSGAAAVLRIFWLKQILMTLLFL